MSAGEEQHLSSTSYYRVSKLLSLSSRLYNESEAVIASCSSLSNDSSTSSFSSSLAFRLDFSCDSCNLTEVEHLWDLGLCDRPPSPGFDAAIYLFYIAILVFAVLGNSVVVYVVCSTAKMRTVTNYFIANLAVGDLCMAIFCVPFSFISILILQYWPFGVELCVTVNYLQAVSVFVSAYTLVAISLDRYLAIIYPLRPRMTRCQAKVIIGVVWAMALLTTLPIPLVSGLYPIEGERG